MKNTIDHLPPRLRETWIRHWEKEQSYQDIAEELNISYENVRKRISQARAILRQQLNEYEGVEASGSAPSRKQRQPIKNQTLASSGELELVLTVANESLKKKALSVEPIQCYQSSHGGQLLLQSNEKSEALPEILPLAKFEPIESVLGEAEPDGKLEEIEKVRGEIEAVLLVGQPAPILYQFNLTVKQWRGVGTGALPLQNPRFPENETALPLRRESEDNFSFRGGWGGDQLIPPKINLVLALGCKSSVGKVKKRPSLIWEIPELFELRWRVWADSGGCRLSSI